MTDQEWMDYRLEEAVWRPDRESCLQFSLIKSTPGGFIAEFGVGRGQSLNYIADMTDETVHGFDLFRGLSLGSLFPFSDDELPSHGTASAPESGRELCQMLDRCQVRFAFNARLWPGSFCESLPIFLDEVRAPARFVHIGCKPYQSVLDALFGLEGRIVRGTVVQFERLWNCWGWQDQAYRALREFSESTGLEFRFLARTSGEQVTVMFR